MWPALHSGSIVRVDTSIKTPKVGDIVVARHPFRRGLQIVKRVVARDPDGSLKLRGDNWIESEDSGSLGRFPPSALVGVVVAVEPPPQA